MKRFLSLCLAVMMIASVCTFVSLADDPDPAAWDGSWAENEAGTHPAVQGVAGRKYYKGMVMFANTGGITTTPQAARANQALTVLGTPETEGESALDAGNTEEGTRLPLYNGNTWITGYAVKVDGVGTDGVDVTISTTNDCSYWQEDNTSELETHKTLHIAKDGAYNVIVPNGYSGNYKKIVQKIKKVTLTFSEDVTFTILAELEGVSSKSIRDGNFRPFGANADAWYSDTTITYHKEDATVDTTLGENGVVTVKATAGYIMGACPSDAVELPALAEATKASDDTYKYVFQGWSAARNSTTAEINYAVGTMDVYPVFKPVDKTKVVVTFKNENNEVLEIKEVMIGQTIGAYAGETAPSKTEDEDNLYLFTGEWQDEEGNKVDLATAVAEEGKDLVLKPVFSPDKKIKIAAFDEDPTAEIGGNLVLPLALTRADVTVGAQKEAITEGSIEITYPAGVFTHPLGEDGKVTVPVKAGGTIDPVTFAAKAGYAGAYSFTITGVVKTASSATARVYQSEWTFQIGDQQAGYYQPGTVTKINANDGENKPERQSVWKADEPIDLTAGLKKADDADTGVTFVFKLDGIEEGKSLVASNMNMKSNLGPVGGWSAPFQADQNSNNWATNPKVYKQVFTENGYYYMWLHYRTATSGVGFSNVSELAFFNPGWHYTYEMTGDDGNKVQVDNRDATTSWEARDNPNANATFQMIAVVANTLEPTVTFYDTDGETELGTITYKYHRDGVDENGGSLYNRIDRALLATPSDLFTELQENEGKEETGVDDEGNPTYGDYLLQAPTKESTIAKVSYKLAGWTDENGNLVEGVYTSGKLYPYFEEIDERNYYTVKFMNGEEVLQDKKFPEGVVPVYEGKVAPYKKSSETKSYRFNGWKDASNNAPAALDGSAAESTVYTYTAQFEEIDRAYDVFFMSEKIEGEESQELARVLHVAPGGTATFPETTPAKPATAEYTYTFDGWVDENGAAVDLTNLNADKTVYAHFTATKQTYRVTFMDEDRETRLGEVDVEFGAAAALATNPTKTATDAYSYEFKGWVDENGAAVDLSSVEENMTVYASYTGTFKQFVDVKPGKWYSEAVEYAFNQGLIAGMTPNEFGLEKTTTRAMVVSILYRLAGEPSVEGIANPFSDILKKDGSKDWFTDAIVWAADEEITSGYTDGTFRPQAAVSRQEIACFFYRYADSFKNYNVDISERTSFADFVDKNDIASWATAELKYALDRGFITGSNDKGVLKMRPDDGATRAEFASMLMRFAQYRHVSK